MSTILLISADRDLSALAGEWLECERYDIVTVLNVRDTVAKAVDLVIIDLPFPRDGGADTLRQVGHAYPETPILALSSAFFPAVDSTGAVARALGATQVLPKPLTRDALLAAIRSLLANRPPQHDAVIQVKSA